MNIPLLTIKALFSNALSLKKEENCIYFGRQTVKSKPARQLTVKCTGYAMRLISLKQTIWFLLYIMHYASDVFNIVFFLTCATKLVPREQLPLFHSLPEAFENTSVNFITFFRLPTCSQWNNKNLVIKR